MTLAPRAYSASQDDFDPDLGVRLIVRVDAVEQADVLSYDVDKGEVIKYRKDANGDYMVNEQRDAIVTDIVRGVVTVDLKPEN